MQRWSLEADLELRRQEDGKFYILPGLHELNNPQYTFAIRADLFEEAGVTGDPATWDEFTDQLEAVVDFHGLDYGLTDGADNFEVLDATLSVAAPNFGTLGGWNFQEGVFHNGSEFEYAGAMDGYRDMVAYFADMHERGVLDPESISQDKDAADQKLLNGSVAARGSDYQEIVNLRNLFAEIGNDEAELRLLTLPAGPAGNNLTAGEQLESGIVISAHAAESDHFVALLQFVDWLYFSDSGMEFAKWGVEGETFTWDGDTRVLNENIDWGGLNPGAPELLNANYGFYNGVFLLAHGSTADLFMSMHREETQEFIEAMNQKTELPLRPPAPLTDEELEEASLLQGGLEDIVQQNTAQFILGQRSLDEWDSYVAELEARGMSTYVEMYNEAASR